jgi:hypothetical protein
MENFSNQVEISNRVNCDWAHDRVKCTISSGSTRREYPFKYKKIAVDVIAVRLLPSING